MEESTNVTPVTEIFMFDSGTHITVLNGPILALDRDQGINAVVTYQLVGMATDFFIINNRTGKRVQLTV